MDSDKKILIKTFCKFRVKEILFNESCFQDTFSDSCGYFVLYFAIQRMHNLDLSFEDILEDIFENDVKDNEKNVILFCENILKEDD